jgi:predicted Fe-S protein YdhL (DUF1289 family)
MLSARLINWLVCLELGVAVSLAQVARGAETTDPGTTGATQPPVPSPPQSPIQYFRHLLSLSPDGLAAALAEKPEAQRTAINAKLQEYASLPEEEREARLGATELRWYLRPMMGMAPANRTQWLAAVPAQLEAVVRERLAQWDGLTPAMRKDVLENDWIAEYFLRYESRNATQREALLSQTSPELRARIEKEMARWQSLSAEDRQHVFGRFQRFFELPDREKERTLNRLSEAERSQLEKTLQAFERLSPDRRQLCVNSFNRFAGMNSVERLQFLRNAERWKEMTLSERNQWRMLVSQLPPLPPGATQPPLPPGAAGGRFAPPPLPNRIQLTNAVR